MKKQLYGCLCALLYVMLSAGQSVFAGSMTQRFSPLVLSFFCFGVVSVTTFVISSIAQKLSFKLVRANVVNFVMVNIMTALLWIGFLEAVKYIEPALAVIIFGIAAPAMITLITPWIRPQSVILPAEKYSALLYLSILVGIVYVVLARKTSMQHYSFILSLIGIFCAVGASLATACLSLYVKKLFDNKLSVLQVLPFRFFMLMIVVAPWLKTADFHMMLNLHALVVVIGFSLIGCLLPMYIGQLSMTLIEPITFSFIAATESLFALVLQLFDKRLHLSAYSCWLVIATSLISVYVIIARLRHENNREKLDEMPLVLPGGAI